MNEPSAVQRQVSVQHAAHEHDLQVGEEVVRVVDQHARSRDVKVPSSSIE